MQLVMIKTGVHGFIYPPPTAVRVPANNGHANSDFGTPNKGDCKRKELSNQLIWLITESPFLRIQCLKDNRLPSSLRLEQRSCMD